MVPVPGRAALAKREQSCADGAHPECQPALGLQWHCWTLPHSQSSTKPPGRAALSWAPEFHWGLPRCTDQMPAQETLISHYCCYSGQNISLMHTFNFSHEKVRFFFFNKYLMLLEFLNHIDRIGSHQPKKEQILWLGGCTVQYIFLSFSDGWRVMLNA